MGTGAHCSGPDPPGHTQRVYAHLLCELFLGQPRSTKLLNQPLNLTLTAPTPAHASLGKHPPSSPPPHSSGNHGVRRTLTKNQWGWGGFVTRDLKRCQIAARNVALVYNWWSLFVACAQPERGREAITSRPLLLAAVGRVTASGRQLTLRLTSTHAGAAEAQSLLTGLSLFLSSLGNAAEQLGHSQRWKRIWERILTPWTRPQGLIPAASG